MKSSIAEESGKLKAAIRSEVHAYDETVASKKKTFQAVKKGDWVAANR
jgi:hypothetical protein